MREPDEPRTTEMSASPPAWLQVRKLSKDFGGAQALSEVDIDIHKGEVHGLVGANGAGKSTLIRCLAGVTAPDHGRILLGGAETTIGSPREAEQAGLAFIHQELNLVPHFNSLQNILLGAPKVTRGGMINWKRSRQAAYEAAERIGVRFSLSKRVDELSVAERWLVMISKALVRRASMIAMDEPTASLSDAESAQLFTVVRDLAGHGVAILYVSHRLDEVLHLSDRLTVLRDGRVTQTATRGDLDKGGLIRAIVGGDVGTLIAPERVARTASSEVIFEASHVSRRPAVRDVSFQLFKGEVLGLAGLVGAGRTELARLAAGADKLDSGGFTLAGKPVDTSSVAASVKAGIALVPEERRSEGLMLEKSLGFNMNLAVLRSLRTVPGLPLVSAGKARRRSLGLVDRLAVATTGINQPIGALSGGNQQKALMARWLTPGLRVLLLDEPSRGVDVGARREIHRAIRELSDSGVGTVVISSEVEELVMLCDRVLVMCEGEVAGVLAGDDLTEERIIELSYAHRQSVPGEER